MPFHTGDAVVVRSKGVGQIEALTNRNGKEGYEIIVSDGTRLFIPMANQEKILRAPVSAEQGASVLKILRTPAAPEMKKHKVREATSDSIADMAMNSSLDEIALELRALYNASPHLDMTAKRKISVLESLVVSEISYACKLNPKDLEAELKSYRDLTTPLPPVEQLKPSFLQRIKDFFGNG